MAEENTCGGCSAESCEGCPSARQPESMLENLNEHSSVKKVIGVVSGKGGVGKSFVTAALASALARNGCQVGIMDADVTGPSIPKMYGIHENAAGCEWGILPIESRDGVKIISVNLLLDDEESPVVWRGPIVAGVVKQFWTDVYWGNLDYLLVDMPPGTGDVPLTVFQSIPVDGIVIVTSPQDLVQMIVNKALGMANMMDIPVLGIVENYSYLKCPNCGEKISVFGESRVDQVAAVHDLDVLGKIPINPAYAKLADDGEFEKVKVEELEPAVKVLEKL